MNDNEITWELLNRPVGKYGPQTAEIEALIERAKSLTNAEAEALDAALDAAWDAARDAAWKAAWVAAWDAARDAARDAAWDAARDAAWNAAWVAARDAAQDAARNAARNAAWVAARALVVRDLIGRHGLTQAHYDLLTEPWARVIGKAHPDDPDRMPKPAGIPVDSDDLCSGDKVAVICRDQHNPCPPMSMTVGKIQDGEVWNDEGDVGRHVSGHWFYLLSRPDDADRPTPRMAEPQNAGAVVYDANGDRWMRRTCKDYWFPIGYGNSRAWADIHNPTPGPGCVLTADDPEPPNWSVVLGVGRVAWQRNDGYWVETGTESYYRWDQHNFPVTLLHVGGQS